MEKNNDTIYARGTLGDTFMIVLKIDANKDKVKKVNHYSKHQYAYPAIKQIYNLIEGVQVNFLKEPLNEQCVNGYMETHETWNPHPDFNLPKVESFNLPDEFSVVQLNSGLNQAWRNLSPANVSLIPATSHLVLVGTDDLDVTMLNQHEYTDLRNKTTIPECLAIIRQAQCFYGPQGFLSFFALSQKVTSNIFLKNQSDAHATNVRIGMIKEWHEYVSYIGVDSDY
jgi:hypothetical protein